MLFQQPAIGLAIYVVCRKRYTGHMGERTTCSNNGMLVVPYAIVHSVIRHLWLGMHPACKNLCSNNSQKFTFGDWSNARKLGMPNETEISSVLLQFRLACPIFWHYSGLGQSPKVKFRELLDLWWCWWWKFLL